MFNDTVNGFNGDGPLSTADFFMMLLLLIVGGSLSALRLYRRVKSFVQTCRLSLADVEAAFIAAAAEADLDGAAAAESEPEAESEAAAAEVAVDFEAAAA